MIRENSFRQGLSFRPRMYFRRAVSHTDLPRGRNARLRQRAAWWQCRRSGGGGAVGGGGAADGTADILGDGYVFADLRCNAVERENDFPR
jgi:hypothetical protein